MSGSDVIRAGSYTKTNIAKRTPVLIGDPLVDAIRQRAFDLKISIADLDRSLGRGKIFRSARRRLPSPRRLHDAVKALGGTLIVQWEGRVITRRRVEDAIDTLIDLLDQIDGDTDLEPELDEEPHDREADPAEDGIADKASMAFILAEKARKARLFRR